MADITVQRTGEIQRKVLEVLQKTGEALPARIVIERVEQCLKLSDFEKSDYPKSPGVRRFDKITRFSTISMVKAGWLTKDKGRWAVTEDGIEALEQHKDPEQFSRRARQLYRDWKSEQPDSDDLGEDPAAAASILEEAVEDSFAEIQAYLHKMLPYELQNLVAALLRAMDYHVSWVSPPGKDGGIDILAHNDPLGTQPPRIKVQVKRKADKVNVEGLRSFLALLGDEDVGIFVSLGGFTSDAECEARTQEKRRITLLDLARLFDLWAEHYSKIEESDRTLLPLRPVHFLELQS